MNMISIIAVTYNAETLLPKTTDSLIEQIAGEYECIFVDGGSTDNTLHILEKTCTKLNAKDINTTLISESDKGIYDAMNKGIRFANGEWIYFLNAGDRFWSVDTIECVNDALADASECDIVYGDIAMDYGKADNSYNVERARQLDELFKHMPFCHQAAFVKKSLLAGRGFDCSFSIAADYDFFLWAYMSDNVFKHIPVTIAIFDTSGESSSNLIQMVKEYRQVQRKNGSPVAKGLYGFLRYVQQLLFALRQSIRNNE